MKLRETHILANSKFSMQRGRSVLKLKVQHALVSSRNSVATLSKTINESVNRESKNPHAQIKEVNHELKNSCIAFEEIISENHKSHIRSLQQLESLVENECEARATEFNGIIIADLRSSMQRLEYAVNTKLDIVEELSGASSELQQQIEEIKHSLCH